MKTVLVTGANGQLGNSIYARISQYPGYNFLFTDIDTLDICDKEAVRKYVLENDVQYVMNCAAYTAVDKAEEHEDLCMRINRDAVLRLGKERDELRFIFDQVGTPTYAGDLAVAMLTVLERAEAGKFIPGIYHFSDEGVCSWYDFTVKILQIAGMNNRVIPIETKDYPTPASRPHYSVLNKGKIKSTYGLTIPHWETSLAYCMNNKV